MKFGVVVFPGSNCDHDAHYALEHVLHQDVRFLWHKDSSIGDVDVIVLPGGFSYGDYLRCGAIARFSPIMKEVIDFADRGGTVVGICNGFQILCEAGLLPGALLRNECLTFVCKYVNVRVENADTRFTSRCRPGEVLRIPIAHGEGNYFADDETLCRLESNGRILFRYCERDGSITEAANPNGSCSNIAGIVNEQGNVMGMMPHPERASDPLLGPTDGQKIFASLIETSVLHDHLTDSLIA
ncbi:MAG: phosphoribosylformylglycinamidine synthase subunit PurQ [Ignavibacteriae bacterium]|nr:phosphoribosylformylglycinamidine synthase subunit PurQ [Ignavibacteria bacterium]MBI3364979.1 phosphoribosylformylglycinamidine synthase subunit PurQ [Ignavibacteriota bacterium]